MTEKDIVITKRTPLLSKANKPYVKVETDSGAFFCWEPKLYPAIPESGKITVLYEQKGKFSNIQDILSGGRVIAKPVLGSGEKQVTGSELMVVLLRIERKLDDLELVEPKPDDIPF